MTTTDIASDLAHLDEPGSLRFERELPGPITRVWDVITDPQLSATWFGDGWTIPSTPGAAWRHASDMHGVVRAYEPPHLLEITWNDDHHDGAEIVDSILRIELREHGGRVHLTLTHRGLPTGAMVGKGPGWHAYLRALHERIEGRDFAAIPFARTLAPTYEQLIRNAPQP